MKKVNKTLVGFSFIEVLIGLFLLSFILLGLDAMGIVALQKNRNAYLLSVADNQLHSMVERLLVFTTHEGLLQHVNIWNKQNQEVLPQGKGTLVGKYPRYTITIFWGNVATNICRENRIGPSGCIFEKIQL